VVITVGEVHVDCCSGEGASEFASLELRFGKSRYFHVRAAADEGAPVSGLDLSGRGGFGAGMMRGYRLSVGRAGMGRQRGAWGEIAISFSETSDGRGAGVLSSETIRPGVSLRFVMSVVAVTSTGCAGAV